MKLSKISSMVAVALGATAALSLSSCSEDCPDYWGKYYGELTNKPAYIWVDAAANFPYLADSKENIATYIAQAKATGFTDIIVDVRGTDGDVLFNTDLVDQSKSMFTWIGSEYKETTRTATWDYLQAFIDAGHAAGVRVHAAMNTMVGGNVPRGTEGRGMLFRDPSKREWCTYVNTADGIKNQLDITDSGETTKFLNPFNPEVKEFIVGLVGDLAKYTDLDGIVLDRGRFKDCTTDFSDFAKNQFKEYVGAKIVSWPTGVMPKGATTVPTENFPKYYKEWWEFRAKAMHDIVEAASAKAKEVNPKVQFSCYVGAWYGSYYQSGVNWASPEFDPSSVAGYGNWATENYKETGYADHIDMLILGCYAKPDKVFGNTEWTVQGFASNGYAKVMGACTVIGGPDIGNNWPTASRNYVFADSDKEKDYYLDQAANTVNACMAVCDGYFMFDICHLQSSPDYWDALAKGFQKHLNGEDDYGRQGEN